MLPPQHQHSCGVSSIPQEIRNVVVGGFGQHLPGCGVHSLA
jgi:hypothetical protein